MYMYFNYFPLVLSFSVTLREGYLKYIQFKCDVDAE